MKNKKIILWLFIFLLLVFFKNVYSQTLTDVKGHWSEKYVNELITRGAITGYDTNKDGVGDIFKPNGQITRAEIAVVVAKTFLFDKAFVDLNILKFSDVTQKHWAAKYIAALIKFNILPQEMIKTGKFLPNQNATRAEVASMVIMALGKIKATQVLSFKDVSANYWAKDSIEVANEESIVTGYPDKTFKPENPVTRAEASAILVRAVQKLSLSELNALKTSSAKGYTGLIINCNGMELEQTQTLYIKDTNGTIIYPPVGKQAEYSIEIGLAAYYDTVEQAKERSGNNPLIIQATSIEKVDIYPRHIIVSVEDGKKILEENQKSFFLEEALVAVTNFKNFEVK